MPHNIAKDRENWAIWITGVPGVGLNSVGEALDGFMTDHIGFRDSHQHPDRWDISTQVLRFRMTNPEEDNPYFFGFGQNYTEVARLPWKYVILLMAGKDQLGERITTYREENQINADGRETSEVIDSVMIEQTRMLEELPKYSTTHIVDANQPKEAVIEAVKSRKWLKTADWEAEESTKYTPGLGWGPDETKV